MLHEVKARMMDHDDCSRRKAAPGASTAPGAPTAFARLPDEIIEQILLATSPNGFASLVMLNSKWRTVSQRSHLYRHQLSRCPSYISSHASLVPFDHEQLPRLRRMFACEVKRSLFDAYLRPRITIVKLVSNSISSSSCPGGEGMRFSASLNGHHLLAYNSSRIYVIDVHGDDLQVKRQLKIMRRPVAACVTDNASLLAVLSTELQVDLYDLQASPPKRKRSLIFDNCPRTIALSSCGSVLAAAYDSGIQVSSLDSGAVPTDRRAVKCDAVDALAFSPDGTQILGTTTESSSPSTVVLTAPYYDPGSQPADCNLAAMWTTSILFPNTSRDCSHATLLPRDGHHGELEWTFTYDRSFETFRAVRLDDLRNGTTYFTGPLPMPYSPSKLLPCTIPASTSRGELVAAGFRGNEVWVYGVPGGLEAASDMAAYHDGQSDSPAIGRHGGLQAGLSRHASSARAHDGENQRAPQWQLICDRQRNNFVAGCKITELAGVTNVKWVAGLTGSSRERLVITARGVSGPRLATEEEDIDFADGGRIALVDFDYHPVDGQASEIVIEVGTDEAEVLEEETRDIAAEVALARQRTTAQRRGSKATRQHVASHANPGPPTPTPDPDDDPLVPRIMGKNPAILRLQAAAGPATRSDQSSMDEFEALDVPYEHASPRSTTTLRRAATAAATNRRLNPRTADGRPIVYRRADGRPEHPHESDADNWVPPPPPYQKEDPGDLPAFMRGPSVPPPTGPSMPPLPPFPLLDARPLTSSPSVDRSAEAAYSRGPRRPSQLRLTSVSTTSSLYRNEAIMRPMSSPSVHSGHLDQDDLYDVSPIGSPRLSAYTFGSPQLPRSTSVPTEPLTADGPPASVRPAALSALPAGDVSPTEDHAPSSLCSMERVSFSHSVPPSVTEPSRRPSHAQTWPLSPTPEAARTATARASTGDSTLTAPSRDLAFDDAMAALPPPPSLEQLASLNRRSSWGNPSRLSGGVRSQSAGAHAEGSATASGREDEDMPSWPGDAGVQVPESDRPLIISTPGGIAGALDPPDRCIWERRGGPQILAPIPRHPRPTHLDRSDLVLESLEQPAMRGVRAQRRPGGLPLWLQTAPAASRSPTTPVHRRPSRAERSAAKNMMDARKRGWTGKRRKRADGTDGASSSAGWTDVSTSSGSKEKKCAVM